MSRRFSTLRFVALLALGALAVHSLRYRIGYHEQAGAALRHQGHAYLSVVAMLVAALVAAALALFGTLLLRARRGGLDGSGATPFTRAWAFASFSLASVYVTQEWLEGRLSQGHPAGLAGIVGHGGWVAFLLAVAIGAAIALLVCGTEAVIALVARRARRARRRHAPLVPRPPRFSPPSLDAIARHLAGRGPPLRS